MCRLSVAQVCWRVARSLHSSLRCWCRVSPRSPPALAGANLRVARCLLPPPPLPRCAADSASESEDESIGDDSEDESIGDDSDSEDGRRRAAAAGAAAGKAAASDRVLRINFSGGEDAGGLEFSAEDIAELRYAVNVTGLAAKPFPEADAALRAHSSPEGILSRKAFYAAVRSLVPTQAVQGADTRRITAFLTRFFDAFDRPGDGVAQLPDVLVGFSLLCAGNKSDKLVDSFSVMSKVASGAVTRTELWRILRALLSAFGAVASRTDDEDVEEKRARIDDAAADVVRAAAEAVGDRNGRVTFQQFAGWFNEEGRGKCPWLELLDLNKWLRAAGEPSAAAPAASDAPRAAVPPPRLPSRAGNLAAAASLSESRVAAPPSEGSSEDSAEDDNSQDPIAFRFDLGRSSELVGRASDIGRVALLLSLTGLHRFTPAEMAAAVMSESHGGVITRAGFDHLAKRLVDVSSLRADERRRAGALLATVFYSFDKFRRDEADATHLATGMLALAGGSKSCKLDVAWTLFEGSRSAPGLTRGLAWECISSLLTGLASLCRDHVFTSVVEMRHVIESGAVDTVSRLFDETRDREDQSVIAFTRFARWYNERGHAEGAVWMELLDHTKWPTSAGSLELPPIPEDEATRARARQQLGVEGPSSTEASVPAPSARAPPAAPGARSSQAQGLDEEYTAGDVGEDGADHDDGEDDEDEALVYSFVVSEAGDVLELTRADCDFLHAVAASAGMSTRPATDLLILQRAAAASNSSATTSISKLSFSQAMEALLRGSGCEGQALRVGRAALRALFSWFDWTGTDQAETAELIVGLSLFCGGSKSVKMALAFDVLDEGGDGSLDHMQLWLFFRSYLLTLGFVQAGSDPLSPSDRRTVVRRVAVEATIAVFESVARVEGVPKVSRITFAQFGQWYNSGGFEPAAWLELLDLSKWSPPSVAAATVARRRLGFDDSRTAASATVAAPYVGRAAFSASRPKADAEDEDEDEDDAGDEDADEDDADEDDEARLSPAQRWETPAFDFPLLRRPEALQAAVAAVAVRCGGLVDSSKLRLTLADCAVVARIVSTARMDSLVADDIVTLVLSAASAQRSSLTRSDFERTVLAAVLPRDDDEGQEWLAGCLERLFSFMDRESTGRASAPELAAALTLFASGSKTEKLTAAWAAFSGSATGRLAKLGLWQLLRSLLGVLCVAPFLEETALTAAHAAALRDEIDVAAISVADSILEFSGEGSASWGQSNGTASGSGSVAFDDFADWYNEGGASQARWVELLDLTKWPDLDSLDASPRRPTGRGAVPDVAGSEADEAAGDADAGDGDAEEDADAAVSASIELLEDGDQQWLTGQQPAPGIRWFLLTEGDVAAVEDALAVTGIAFVDPWDICKAVVAHAGPDNSLSRDGFIKCMRELLSPARVPAARVEMAQRLIWRVWYAVDPHGDDSVPAASAAAALTLLAGGSKSGKIASAFEAAAVMEGSTAGVHPATRDDENPSFVTRDSLKLVIRGFVAALLGLTEQAANAEPASVAATSEIVAKRVAHRVFAHAGSGRSASFIDFGNWYNAGGFKSESWVEMLDLRKWSPSVAAFVGDPEADDADEGDDEDDDDDDAGDAGSDQDGSDGAGPEEDADSEAADDDQDDENEEAGGDYEDEDESEGDGAAGEGTEQVRSMRASASRDAVFGFRVMAGGNVVALSAHDVAGMSTIVREARLDAADPEAVLEAFNKRVNSSGELDREGFAEALSSFVDPGAIPAETLVQLRSGLERMFDVFDEDASGTVDFAEFAAGFSVLCSGSKSDKLVLAFRLFDIDGDGFITHAELEQYLSSFVAALISFGGAAGSGMARLSAEEASARRRVARQMAADLASKILEQADTNKDGLISFAEFGEWYNSGGHELVPWMEMLSTGKWGVFADSAPQPSSGGAAAASAADAAAAAAAAPSAGTGSSSAADDEDDAEGAVSNDTVMLGFDLPGGADSADGAPLRVELTARDARQLRRITSASRLRVLDPDTLHTLFDAEADEASRTLDEAGFARVMERVVPRSSLTDEDAAAVRSYVGSIFAAFDTSLDGRVDFAEFAAGFSILCAGSKSDKLALAFRLFDANGDGRISRVELALYVRAFLLSLITLLRSGTAPLDEATRTAASREAAKVAGTVFAAADLNRDGSIDFQEFGTWYNSGGHNLVPWIELLDQSKWPLQDDRQVAMLREPDSGSDDEEDVDVSAEFDDASAGGRRPDEAEEAEEAAMPSRNALERVQSLRPGEHTIHVLVPAGRDEALTPVAAFAGRHTVFADRLARASTLARCSPSELFAVVRSAFDSASGRESPVTAFAAALARRAADAGVPAEERAWLSAALPQVLSALRLGFGSDPSAEELAVALLPLCAGSKSPKFSMAAERMADRPMSCLSHVGVRAMLHAMIQGLLAVRGVAGDDARRLVDGGMGSGEDPAVARGMSHLAIEVGLEAGLAQRALAAQARGSDGAGDASDEDEDEDTAALSFEALSMWYNEGGHTVGQWLELLDISKWPPAPLERPGGASAGAVSTSPGSKSTRTDEGRVVVVDEEEDVEGEAEDVGEGDAEDGAAPPHHVLVTKGEVFRLPLMPRADAPGEGFLTTLVVSFPDCAIVQRAIRSSGLDRLHVTSAMQAAREAAAAGSGAVLAADLERTLMAMAPASDFEQVIGRDGVTDLSRMCAWLSDAVAASSMAEDDQVALAVGAAIAPFCAGSKSDKLAALFTAFASADAAGGATAASGDADEDAGLNSDQLAALLASVLTGICAVSSACRAADPSFFEVQQLADAVSSRIAATVGRDVQGEDGLVTFGQFGEWYNGGGYVEVQWLELMDQRKWPDVLAGGDDEDDDMDDPDDEDYMPGQTDEDTDEDDDDDDYEDEDEEGDDDDERSDEDASQVNASPDADSPEETSDVDEGGSEPIDMTSPSRSTPALAGNGASHAEAAAAAGAASADGSAAAVFSFVVGRETELTTTVNLSEADRADFRAAASSSGLSRTSARDLIARVFEAADASRRVAPDGLRAVLRSVRREAATDGEGGGDDLRFSTLFSAMLQLLQASAAEKDQGSLAMEDSLDASACAVCLTVCCAGSKTDKMRSAFFTTSALMDGYLSLDELAAVLANFLIGIFAASSSMARHSASRLASLAVVEGRQVASSAFLRTMRVRELAEPPQAISFDEFGAFYNELGFRTAPWVEMLGFSKW